MPAPIAQTVISVRIEPYETPQSVCPRSRVLPCLNTKSRRRKMLSNMRCHEGGRGLLSEPMIPRSRTIVPQTLHREKLAPGGGGLVSQRPAQAFVYGDCRVLTIGCLLSLEYHHQAHDPQHDCLQPGMLAKHDSNITHCWNVTSDTPDYIFFSVQVALSSSI